jgi:5-formyltetrahydrofolate cyclo-ligase
MSDAKLNKARLRSALRQRRQALGADIQRLAAQALTHFVVGIPDWPGAQRIALYLAADGEIDPGPLGALAHTQGKQLFLPVIKSDNSLSFAAWLTQDSLLVNRYGIPEPPAHARRCPATDLDIIFLPLVGWDDRGGRLGMGGGFYDRSLSGVTGPLLVGLAHSSQQVDRIPRDNWDISLDFIATEASLHCCQE